MSHTSRPWALSDILDNGIMGVVTNDNDIIIGTPNRLTDADKRLIAAAPNLLEALKRADEALALIKAAIANAEGQSGGDR